MTSQTPMTSWEVAAPAPSTQAAADLDAELMAEAERMRAASIEASHALVREHLLEFLSRNPGATYEAWIAALHPENVQLDHRLRFRNNPWIVAWSEAGTKARMKEIRWLHALLTVVSAAWTGFCIYMLATAHKNKPGKRIIMPACTCISVLLFAAQVVSLFTSQFLSDSDWWPRHVYKVAAGQLVLQTCVTILGLTTWIFRGHGLLLTECIRQGSCETTLRGKGFEQDMLVWNEIKTSRVERSVFSVAMEITMADHNGRWPLDRKILRTSNNKYWDGIRVQAAVPLHFEFSQEDKIIITWITIVWALALGSTIVYLWTYCASGQSRRRWGPTWHSLQRLECIGCLLCFAFLLLNTWAYSIHVHSVFVAPTFIGVAVQAALVTQFLASCRRRHPATGPFNQWQIRTMTTQGVGLMVAFTYMAGLTISFILCSSANIWPGSLPTVEAKEVFNWCSLLHLLLSVGYAVSMWAHMYLARLRSASRLKEEDALADVAELTVAESTVAESPFPSPRPSTYSHAGSWRQTASSGEVRSPRDVEADLCTSCREDYRDTVLVPCSHTPLCTSCATSLMKSRRPQCPICSRPIDDVVKMYKT